MGIGGILSEVLKSKNVTVTDLARKIDVAPTTIYSIIERDNMKIDISVLIKICNALDTNIELFYQDYLNDVPKKMDNFSIADEEINLLNLYRSIDIYGKKAVESILKVEYERCNNAHTNTPIISITDLPANHDVIEMKRAARDGRKISTEMITREEANAIKSMPDTPEDL